MQCIRLFMWTAWSSRCERTSAGESRALYLALGVDMQGQKELLGMWMSQSEGARILAGGVHRIAEPRGERHLHRLYGWPHRSSRSRGDASPTVYGAYGAPLAQVCLLQTSQRGGSRLEADLQCGDGGRSADLSRSVCREVGSVLFLHQQAVAHPLESPDPLVCLPRRHSASVIYTTNAIESVNMSLRHP